MSEEIKEKTKEQEEMEKKQKKFVDELDELMKKYKFTLKPEISMTVNGIIPVVRIYHVEEEKKIKG